MRNELCANGAAMNDGTSNGRPAISTPTIKRWGQSPRQPAGNSAPVGAVVVSELPLQILFLPLYHTPP